MRIPQIREELLSLARDMETLDEPFPVSLWAEQLRMIESELYRRPYVRKVSAKRVTPKHALIQEYAQKNPDMDYMDIAAACGCNTGRVSEALAGYRQ